MGEKKQNKGVGVVLMMLLLALVPLGITSIILTIIGVRLIDQHMEEQTIDTLRVASTNLRIWYEWFIDEGQEPSADDPYIDCLKDMGVELTL
ncbi:MAG: hypothetical protein IKR47_01215, partial [Lachnospiraceae bacterium]|nr:hypothetical protein [Lachnospiraceae bacterium]